MTSGATPKQHADAEGGVRVELRPAGLDDVTAIARFQVAAWRSAYRGLLSQRYLGSLSEAGMCEEWQGFLTDGRREAVLAHLGDELVAVASWGPADVPAAGVPELELKSIYVDAALHGTGLALALLEYALGGAPAQLWMFEGNARADAFYRKHGFAPDGGRLRDEPAQAWELRYVR